MKGATPVFQFQDALAFSISIHAPMKGAAISFLHLVYLLFISIHAPTKGAARVNAPIVNADNISIHAPIKGAAATLSNKKVVLESK